MTGASIDMIKRPSAAARLQARDLTIGYDRRVISESLSVDVPDGAFTVIVGPNACGKSTLLRALSRLLTPTAGTVLLDGKAITSYPAKEVARRLGLLPQSSIAPDGIRVGDLVARGRYPHQKLIRQWSAADEAAVVEAMAATGVTELSAGSSTNCPADNGSACGWRWSWRNRRRWCFSTNPRPFWTSPTKSISSTCVRD